MIHKQQLPEAEYKDLRRIFHVQIGLLVRILCKADQIKIEKASIKQNFGEKIGQWLCSRIWRGAGKTNFGNKVAALLVLAKANVGQAKTSADFICNDIKFFKRWNKANYGMKFPTLPDQWKNAIHDVCIPFYESWLCGSGFKNSNFEIAVDCMNRKRIMSAFRANNRGVCGYCDGALGDVGATKEANDCEHFFPKSKFPHLCIHPCNLFVSCKGCNETWKIDNAPMGVADPPGLKGTYHPQFRPGINQFKVTVSEQPNRKYKLTLQDNRVPERVVSLNAALDIDCRWTNDINERLDSNLSELIAESLRVSRINGPINSVKANQIISDVVDYRQSKIGKNDRMIRDVAVLKHQQANQLSDLLIS